MDRRRWASGGETARVFYLFYKVKDATLSLLEEPNCSFCVLGSLEGALRHFGGRLIAIFKQKQLTQSAVNRRHTLDQAKPPPFTCTTQLVLLLTARAVVSDLKCTKLTQHPAPACAACYVACL